MSNIPNDLVQCDIDTALVLYTKGYTHIPILKRDGLSQDWSSLQPLYLDDLLDGVMAFCSDSKRESLLNPPKTDIGHVKEEIYLEAEKTPKTDAGDPTEGEMDDILCGAVYDEDDDPDWVETEPEAAEEIPEEDEVPTVSKVTEETDSTDEDTPWFTNTKQTVEDRIRIIELEGGVPAKWNVKEAIRLHDKEGVAYGKLATFYGVSYPTVTKRINEYKAKS